MPACRRPRARRTHTHTRTGICSSHDHTSADTRQPTHDAQSRRLPEPPPPRAVFHLLIEWRIKKTNTHSPPTPRQTLVWRNCVFDAAACRFLMHSVHRTLHDSAARPLQPFASKSCISACQLIPCVHTKKKSHSLNY